jgi:aldose 1-epimerase
MIFEVTINNEQQHPIITLKNSNNCSAEIYAFGGFVNAFSIATANGFLNVIDGFSSVEDAFKNITAGFKSSFLSPFTCRMKNGEFDFDNKAYKIDKFYLPPHAIHGIVYDAVYTVKVAEANDDKAFVTLEYFYSGQDNGYPYPFSISHTWVLEADNTLSVTTTVTHTNNQAIPYAQGWHPYFKLGGLVDDYTLQFDSNTMLEFDDTLLPTGKLLLTNQFEKDGVLQDIILDNCFELSQTVMHSKCVLKYKNIIVTIIPDASYPYLQIYTPAHRKSIALENLSGAPDCFNNGLGLRLIEPHTSAIFTTSYIVTASN